MPEREVTWWCEKCEKAVTPVLPALFNPFEYKIDVIARKLRFCPFCGAEVIKRSGNDE